MLAPRSSSYLTGKFYVSSRACLQYLMPYSRTINASINNSLPIGYFNGLLQSFMKNFPRNMEQHNAYAMHRARLAFKASAFAQTGNERIKACRWGFAWATIASVQALWQHPIPPQLLSGFFAFNGRQKKFLSKTVMT